MTRRLLLTYLTITAFALAIVVIPFGVVFAGREKNDLLFDIERDAQVVASRSEDDLENGVAPQLDTLLADYRANGGRIVIVDPTGMSVADSEAIGGPPQDFSNRPEIQAALRGGRANGVRHSETAGTGLVFVAIPVVSNGVVHGAVRITYPTSTLEARVRSNWIRLGVLSALVLLVVTAVGVVMARSVSRPVRRMQEAAHRMALGDLTVRVPTDEGPPELRDLAATFNLTAERLSQLIDSQRRFVADASHQLRTPLTALRLRLETLGPRAAAADRPRLEAAVNETARLGRLVQSLLVLARLDAAPHDVTDIDVAAIVTERTETWVPVAGDHAVQLTSASPPGLTARAVPGALEQILDNLISNALDAAPAGSTVTIQVARAHEGVDVHVIDQGTGMTDEQRAHAFERFWRPAGAAGEGFGLGLAIVSQLADASGGAARIDTGPGGVGLDVVVHLPAGSINTQSPTAHVEIPNPVLTST